MNLRWCSGVLKIDVANKVLRELYPIDKEDPFKVLFITGERSEESPKRAKYERIQPHVTSSKAKSKPGRIVHQWRPIHNWKEQKVWEIMKKYRIKPHPVYELGFPRLSCRSCIYFSKDHWTTLNDVAPKSIKELTQSELEFKKFHERKQKQTGETGKVVWKLDNKLTIPEMVNEGDSLITDKNKKYIKEAMSAYKQRVVSNTLDDWYLPDGAFRKGGGNLYGFGTTKGNMDTYGCY
ncbi:hypothetical protein GCM10023331_25870 [Algivirga pacifica]|uniref:Phosphoadenosine phosphosulphate reductase domain-containing protein n=2 Tax=Algivirga pacifica TaxID=1162670 RepID=A0ABP9DDL9_9BACT